MNDTIYETFVLPSRGQIYDKEVNPTVELTSMKTWQEMKRLSPSDTPYKVMCDIIEECMRTKLGIPVYDLCLGDYQYLLTKLRIVTYGSEYKMATACPKCGNIVESIADLDSMVVNEYDDSFEELKTLELPSCGKTVELTFQTPRKLDDINKKAKAARLKTKVNADFTLLYTLMSLIKKVDGNILNVVGLEDFCKNLGMKDVNAILKRAEELNNKVGMDNDIAAMCTSCGEEVVVGFRMYPNEFYSPTN